MFQVWYEKDEDLNLIYGYPTNYEDLHWLDNLMSWMTEQAQAGISNLFFVHQWFDRSDEDLPEYFSISCQGISSMDYRFLEIDPRLGEILAAGCWQEG